MKKEEFRELLLDSAFFVMACDGDIHDEELRAIRDLSERTPYFDGIELDARIAELTADLKSDSRRACLGYFARLREGELDSVQQLLVVEVVLRVTYADLRLDDNEVLFLKTAVKALGLHHEHLKQRFGSIEGFLEEENPQKSQHVEVTQPPFEIPEFANLGGALEALQKRLDEEEEE